MAVRLKYADLTYVKQPDARPLDLTSFREAGAAITAVADNLQERAIRNENAYNEMAIKNIMRFKVQMKKLLQVKLMKLKNTLKLKLMKMEAGSSLIQLLAMVLASFLLMKVLKQF